MDKIENGEKFATIVGKMNVAIEHCVPTGCVLPYVGTTAPEGWLLCNGANYDIQKYLELAHALGYSGNTGKFNVPDLRGKYLKGGSNGYTSNNGTLNTPFYVWNYGSIDMTSKYGYGVTASEKGKIEMPNVELNFIIKC